MKISEMNQNELLGLADELGADSGETFHQSANRFRDQGDDETAQKFDDMEERWFEIEGA
jgi:hypothetical protein